MLLGEFSRHGAAVELVNRFLGEVLTPGDIDGLEPATTTPAPRRAGRHADLLQPAV